jgi:hypothetical protein
MRAKKEKVTSVWPALRSGQSAGCGKDRDAEQVEPGDQGRGQLDRLLDHAYMWIGLPVTAIAASFSASEWVGWAWQV